MPFKNANYFCERRYDAVERNNGNFDTLKLSKGYSIRESYFNNNGYLRLDKNYLEDGTFYFSDSCSIEFYPNNLLNRVVCYNTRWKENSYCWKTEYDNNKLVKRYAIYSLSDSIIVEMTFDYNPKNRIIVTTTKNDKNQIMSQTTYHYGKRGRMLSEETNDFLKKETSKSTYSYLSKSNYRKDFESRDSSNCVLIDGYYNYRNNLLTEVSHNKYSKWHKYQSLQLNKYDRKKRLKEEYQRSSNWFNSLETSVDIFKKEYHYEIFPQRNETREIIKNLKQNTDGTYQLYSLYMAIYKYGNMKF